MGYFIFGLCTGTSVRDFAASGEHGLSRRGTVGSSVCPEEPDELCVLDKVAVDLVAGLQHKIVLAVQDLLDPATLPLVRLGGLALKGKPTNAPRSSITAIAIGIVVVVVLYCVVLSLGATVIRSFAVNV